MEILSHRKRTKTFMKILVQNQSFHYDVVDTQKHENVDEEEKERERDRKYTKTTLVLVLELQVFAVVHWLTANQLSLSPALKVHLYYFKNLIKIAFFSFFLSPCGDGVALCWGEWEI